MTGERPSVSPSPVNGQVSAAVSVPATTANLGPGFDAFGAALSLRATFTAVDRETQAARVTSSGHGVAGVHAADGADLLPTGEDNLVWRSLVAACEHFGWEVPDVALQVVTPIPQARGLGSSSSAIVGGIALARVLAAADAAVGGAAGSVGDLALVGLAAELEGHPDNVAPAVLGGLVACATTDDDELVTRTATPPATTRPMLLVPPEPSLTSEARAALPADLSAGDVAVQAARAGHVLAALGGIWPVDPRLAGDRLHEPTRTAALAAGGPLLAQLRAAGHHAWLSGAGPALAVAVPLCAGETAAEVRSAAEAAGHAVMDLEWDRQGIRSCVPDGCGVAGGPGCADCPLPSLR